MITYEVIVASPPDEKSSFDRMYDLQTRFPRIHFENRTPYAEGHPWPVLIAEGLRYDDARALSNWAKAVGIAGDAFPWQIPKFN